MNTKFLAFLLLLGLSLTACSTKTNESTVADEASQNDPNEWAEMDSFHMIMAESFHPYKDSTNLEPVKRLAEEMATEAEKWAATELPEKVNTDDMKARLNQLKADTRSLADQVKAGATDDELGAALTALHDSFHGIMEAWNGGGEKHQH